MLGSTISDLHTIGNLIASISSLNHGKNRITADNYILATGNLFSRGICSSQTRIYEPLLGLDIDKVIPRQEWYNKSFFDNHNYNSFGVVCDSKFRAIRNGTIIENLYVADAILGGYNPIIEGCGGGVALLSGIAVAENILNIYKQ